MELSTDDLGVFFGPEHAAVAERVRAFAAGLEPVAGDDGVRTREAARALGAAGLTALAVPEQGADVDVRALCLVREALAQRDGLVDTAFAMQGLGSYPLTLAATLAQRERYLPGLRDGSRPGAFALTEPEAGSDVASLRCHARPQPGGGWRLTGEKTFISNAGVAAQYVVFATVDPAAGRPAITAFVVEPDDLGLTVEPFEVLAPHPIGTLRFDDLPLSPDRLLGEVGGGFKLALRTLDVFRPTVAAAAVGIARRALAEAQAHTRARRQFGKPLAEHQLTAASLAEMAVDLDAARLLVYRAAHARDARGRASREVAMAKLFATEAAGRVVDRAVQLFGGRGVKRGEVVERLYREVRALRIYEGTSEIQKLIIAG